MLVAIVAMFAACSKAGGGSGGGSGESQPSVFEQGGGAQPAGRMIVYTASLGITCKDVERAITTVRNSLVVGEWFDEENIAEKRAYFKARVKTDRLDSFVKNVTEGIGDKTGKSFRKSAKDITVSYSKSDLSVENQKGTHSRCLLKTNNSRAKP